MRGEVVPAGPAVLRLYWEQSGVLSPVGRGEAARDGTFEMSLTVPTAAEIGAARVALLAEDGSPEDLASIVFDVTAAAPARIAGVLRNAAGQGVGGGVKVRVAGPDGLAVAETVTDGSGGFLFAAPPGSGQVQVMTGGYPPETVSVVSGENLNLEIDPSDLYDKPLPPVMMLSAGAVALPGGAYSGSQPVRVGDWSEVPLARLVSLKGKGQAPLHVRFWAEIQRITMPPDAPLVVVFELRKGGLAVAPQVVTDTLTTVYPEGKLNIPAFSADFNSLELTPGKLTLVVGAFTTLFTKVGWWEFPVEVVDLGQRWYSNHVKNPALKVTREDFFTLRYEFSGALPKLPSVGTPLFNEPLDLEFTTVQNRFDLGIALKERFYTHGGWWGNAEALAKLTLFSLPILDEGRTLVHQGSSLAASTYSFQPVWSIPLFGEVCIPLIGPALPDYTICGQKFGGKIGVHACLSGEVQLTSQVQSDLRLDATVAPGLKLRVPVGVELEAAVCKAVASLNPTVEVKAPIKLDPWHTPAVYWDGLCVKLSTTLDFALTCCEIGLDKSVNLFDPIKIGNCPNQASHFARLHGTGEPSMSPPRHAALACSPAGYAVAVWENYDLTAGGRVRTAPVYSVFDGRTWSEPQLMAGPEFAGWEPQIGFLDAETAVVAWTVPGDGGRRQAALAGPQPHGACDTVSDLIELGCGAVGTIVKGAKTVVSVVKKICPFCTASQAGRTGPVLMGEPSPPEVLGDGIGINVRPVLATNPANGDGVIVWLGEQEPLPGRQQALALFVSRLGRAGWSAPERLDPASNFLDLQPSLRFDREGRPAVVWLRDFDNDLRTPADRLLVFSRLEGGWSAPEALRGLPTAPWTPSLDFDQNSEPVVAFVVPAADPRTGEPLGGDGTTSTLHLARRSRAGWTAQPVGDDTRAERPVLRINPENHALVFYRAFGLAGRSLPSGEIASAVADLADAAPRWAIGPITAGRRMNWQVAADLNPLNGEPFLLWETRDPLDFAAEPELRGGPQAWATDLAFAEPGLAFSAAHPTPGQPVDLTARVVNLGLKPLGPVSFRVSFFDREPVRGAAPFATRTLRGPLAFGEELAVTAAYTPADRGWRTFYARVDVGEEVAEFDEANNQVAADWGGLAAPGAFTATPQEGADTIRLEWSSSVADSSVRYWLWRTRVRTGETELLGATFGETFADTTATAGEEYTYELVALDPTGLRSAGGVSGSVIQTQPGPLERELLTLNVVSHRGAITLTWTPLPTVQLQATDELAGARTPWRPVTGGVDRFGGVAQITLPAVQGQRFFRLALP